MVAASLPLLSDQPPELPRRAGLGDRFHYFRGHSGRRYIFTRIDLTEIADFRDAVAVSAEPAADGRLIICSVALLDSDSTGLPPRIPGGRRQVVLVHLLAGSDSARRAVVKDLTGVAVAMAA